MSCTTERSTYLSGENMAKDITFSCLRPLVNGPFRSCCDRRFRFRAFPSNLFSNKDRKQMLHRLRFSFYWYWPAAIYDRRGKSSSDGLQLCSVDVTSMGTRHVCLKLTVQRNSKINIWGDTGHRRNHCLSIIGEWKETWQYVHDGTEALGSLTYI